MANQTVWVDIPVKELDRAIKFYSAVLGSPAKKEQFPEMTIGILPHDDGFRAIVLDSEGNRVALHSE